MTASPANIDGIQKPKAPPKKGANERFTWLLIIGVPYLLFLMWQLFLVSVLPNPQGNFRSLITLGMTSSGLAIIALLAAAFLLVRRVLKVEDLPDRTRLVALLKIIGAVIPGIFMSAFVLLTISGEPALTLRIVEPTNAKDFIAPLAVTFSATEATEILERRGHKVIKYEWDFDGDGEVNEETAVPEVSAFYDRQGVVAVAARMYLEDGSIRRIYRRLTIPRAVFSTEPHRPIVDEPVTFSVFHLQSEANEIIGVQWDFDGDGEIDEDTVKLDVDHTYLQTGEVTVKATVLFATQTQAELERTIFVNEPEPLPFPVNIVTEPKFLISPPPFGVIFLIETNEPHHEVVWDMDDGNELTGDRIGHRFDSRGTFRVEATVRSLSGAIAKVSKLVKVVETLRIPDLSFDGSQRVTAQGIEAEVPVDIFLTPKTSLPLVEFFWEAPGATVLNNTDTTLQATYRKPGTYTITLIGSDPSGSVMRMPIKLEVRPPGSSVRIRMTPDSGIAPQLVKFDASETVIPNEEITGFEWQFGDVASDQPRQGGAQIEHIFQNPGTYTVMVTAFTTTGNSMTGEKTIVIRPPLLDACFTASRTKGEAPMGVSFDESCSAGNHSRMTWNFGDGATSDQSKPVHVFELPGTYQVILELHDPTGTVSTETITITAE